jgi:hypothetical protein
LVDTTAAALAAKKYVDNVASLSVKGFKENGYYKPSQNNIVEGNILWHVICI